MEIVATFVPGPGSQIAQELSHPPAGAGMVELRADLLPPGVDHAALISICPKPVIVTLRSRGEGGAGPADAEARRSFYQQAVTWPAAFFDLEAELDRELVGRVIPKERVILSAHFPGGLPADFEAKAATLLGMGTGFVKLVPTVNSFVEALGVIHLQQALDHGSPKGRRAVIFAAGEAGRATRLLGPLFGGPFAYAAWNSERAAAPGQYTAEEMQALIGHLRGRPRRLFAVLGKGVGGSLSPCMHAAAYRDLGLPHVFVPFDIGEARSLDALIQPFGATCLDDVGLPLGGYAVTMPWKEEAAKRCTVLAPRAERAHAANTVLPRPGKVLGDCTDIDGITRAAFEGGCDLTLAKALVLGSGGAARAAAVALQLAGAEVVIVARDAKKAQALAQSLEVETGDMAVAAWCDVVVNATPAGGDGATDPWLDSMKLPTGGTVIDLPYGKKPTFFENKAEMCGWTYVGGRDVLLYQGLAQFAAMNGVAPPVQAMAAALGLDGEQA